MQTPPPNYKAGLERSRVNRSAKAKAFERIAWDWIFFIASLYNPQSLREYCSYLNDGSISTARGGPWSPGQVSRILEKHGVTAKSLSQRVKQPPTREMKPISVERHRAAAKQIARVDNDGRWVIATDVRVRKNDLVRHPVHGEGQAVKVHLRRVLCRFLLLEEYFPLTEIEVFCYTLSREKRQEATKRIWKRFGL